MASGEVWRVVPSIPALLASSEGRVMVAPYVSEMPNGGFRQYGGEPTFGVWSKTDARFITVYKGTTYKTARLVCEAFNGPPGEEKGYCLHVDENAANNRPSNLVWGTQKENLNHAGFVEYARSGPAGMRDYNSAIKSRAEIA